MTTDDEGWAEATKDNIDPKVVRPLPRIPKAVSFQNARLVGSGLHSEVYSVSATYKTKTVTVALKFFSEAWKEKFEAEVRAYEFLVHSSVSGVVPTVYGCDRDWDLERLQKTLGNTREPTSRLRPPVSVVMMEYISESVPLSPDNVTWRICKEVLRGLYLIHSAQVLQRDVAERNILVVSSTGRVVWVDFSSSHINPDDMESWDESKMADSILYQHVVYPPQMHG